MRKFEATNDHKGIMTCLKYHSERGSKRFKTKKCHNKLLQGRVRAFRCTTTTGTWYLESSAKSWHLTMAHSQPPACRKVFTTKTSVLPKVSTGLDSLDWNDIALLSKSSSGSLFKLVDLHFLFEPSQPKGQQTAHLTNGSVSHVSLCHLGYYKHVKPE